ncbi:MAG: exodeoxyribonuclease VII small subunit [Gemmatimonadota bacterium]
MTGNAAEDFESALAELERVVEALGRDEMTLDEALRLFETGVGNLRAATRRLEDARGRVEELIEDAAGELDAVGFEAPEPDADGGD